MSRLQPPINTKVAKRLKIRSNREKICDIGWLALSASYYCLGKVFTCLVVLDEFELRLGR